MKEFSYEDISLIPQRCIVSSRSECDTSVRLGQHTFELPVIPANMKSVINEETCVFFAENRLFYIMHRFGVDNNKFIQNMHKNGLYASISVGVNGDTIDNICSFSEAPEYITIDVANAWMQKTKEIILLIREKFPNTFLIVGNVATKEAVKELQEWGAMCCKVGIGGGKSCITRNKTGFYRPCGSTVLDCCDGINIPIIADGGVREHGDIAKAISLGATMVMAGSIFSGYDQSAGEIIEVDGRYFKEYFGNASEFTKNSKKHVEGKKVLEPYKGDMKDLLSEMKDSLQSSISYCGGRYLEDLKNFKKFIFLK